MSKIAMRKSFGTLRPCEGQEEAFKRIPNGDVMIEVSHAKRPRSIRQHKLYWALMTLIAENTDQGWNAEDVSFLMKIATGHFDELTNSRGETFRRPRSISFAAMDQDDFMVFFDKCIDVVNRHIIPGAGEDMRKEVEAMVMS